MKLISLGIEGVWLAESHVWADERGYFREWFKWSDVEAATGFDFKVSQANISKSAKGVIRGIHYSLAKKSQAKWVTCAAGHVLDFIVDIRPGSPTYKKYVQVDLNATEGRAILINGGLGHAFLSLEDDSVVSYLLNSPYSPNEEFEINPMDPELGINWKLGLAKGVIEVLSFKDAHAPTLNERFLRNQLPSINF